MKTANETMEEIREQFTLYEHYVPFHTSRNRHWSAPHLQQRILQPQMAAILRPLPGVLHIRN
jgi:hypothetical protein